MQNIDDLNYIKSEQHHINDIETFLDGLNDITENVKFAMASDYSERTGTDIDDCHSCIHECQDMALYGMLYAACIFSDDRDTYRKMLLDAAQKHVDAYLDEHLPLRDWIVEEDEQVESRAEGTERQD